MALKQTPSQTIGPFFAYAMTAEQYGYPLTQIAGGNLLEEETEGDRIRISGHVFDGSGAAAGDAVVEIWQADAQGRYAHPADKRGANIRFKGFGRFGTGTDERNRFAFETIKPGATEVGAAPHINVIVFLRGLLNHVYTRIYFPDEAEANATDPVLALVEEARRATLIATAGDAAEGTSYHFDIHMQGPLETVFFDL